jgi:hypothetical protein
MENTKDSRMLPNGNKVVPVILDPLEWQRFQAMSKLLYDQSASDRIRKYILESNLNDADKLREEQ